MNVQNILSRLPRCKPVWLSEQKKLVAEDEIQTNSCTLKGNSTLT